MRDAWSLASMSSFMAFWISIICSWSPLFSTSLLEFFSLILRSISCKEGTLSLFAVCLVFSLAISPCKSCRRDRRVLNTCRAVCPSCIFSNDLSWSIGTDEGSRGCWMSSSLPSSPPPPRSTPNCSTCRSIRSCDLIKYSSDPRMKSFIAGAFCGLTALKVASK